MSTKLDCDYSGLLQFVAETLDHCSPRETQEFLKFPLIPLRMIWDLSPFLYCCKSPRPHTQAAIHMLKYTGWSRTSLVLLKVWLTLNSDCFSGYHLVGS